MTKQEIKTQLQFTGHDKLRLAAHTCQSLSTIRRVYLGIASTNSYLRTLKGCGELGLPVPPEPQRKACG